jgi:hypothetical protein
MDVLAEMNWSDAWPIIATLASLASTLICSLAMFIFNGFRKEIAKNTQDIELIKDRFGTCRRECDENHASKEDYLREAGYTRRFQERQIADMAEIKTLVSRMPELTGQIVRSIVVELKRGEQ